MNYIHRSIGYHTRLDSDTTQKVTGGSFGGSIDLETVQRLVNSHFVVTLKPSGRVVFVDRQDREVRVYLSVDASMTTQGRVLIAQRDTERRELEEAQQAQIDGLLDSLSPEEIIARLSQT